LVLTTNNASEMPLRSPLSHLLAWIEKAVAADVPRLMSLRPWIWPERVDPELVPPGTGDVYLPHTHHISAETRALLRAAGLETQEWGSFEFPPPQSMSARLLERAGAAGIKTADVIESISQRAPGIRRLGTHLLIVARKTGAPVAPAPPRGVWPGPFSGDGPMSEEARATNAPNTAAH
jgi:hypothetical protein